MGNRAGDGCSDPWRSDELELAHHHAVRLGQQDGMKTRRECTYQRELDMPTLVATRGRDFPLAGLESRLRCPRCGSRRVAVMFNVPKQPMQNFAAE
jgi:hypothetical protein